MARDAAGAVAELHRMGVVHGDLRIDQFMLSSSTGGDGSEGRRVA